MEDLNIIPNDKCRNLNESNLESKPGLLVINSYLNQINPDLKDVQSEIKEVVGMVDHLSFESHNTSSNTTDMILYTSGKNIHSCPLKKTLNMLPKLSHIDKIDPKDERKSSQNESEEEEEESEQIMAKFKDRPGKKVKRKNARDGLTISNGTLD